MVCCLQFQNQEEHKYHPSLDFQNPRNIEVLKILFQYLKQNGLQQSALMLEKECSMELESQAVKRLKESILKGAYEEINLDELNLKDQMRTVSTSYLQRIEFLILQEQYLEQIHSGSMAEALELLRKELTPRSQDPSVLHKLASLVFLSPQEQQKQIPFNLDDSRRGLLTRVQENLPSTLTPPPHRLQQLLNQAAVFQSLGGKPQSRSQLQKLGNFLDAELPRNFSFFKDFKKVDRLPTDCLLSGEMHSDEIWMIRITEDGSAMATVGKDRLVVIYDLDFGGESSASHQGNESTVQNKLRVRVRSRIRPFSSFIRELSWSVSGKYLAVSSDSGCFKIYDAESGKAVAKNKKHNRAVKGIVWMGEDDKYLLTGALDSKIRLWSVEKLISLNNGASPEHEWSWSPVASVLLSRPMKKILIRSLSEGQHKIRVYDCQSRGLISEIKEEDKITSMALSRDGRSLLANVSFRFPVLHLWNIEDNCLEGSYFGHKQERFQVECTFGGGSSEPYVLAGSEDARIFIWSKITRELIKTVSGHVGTINSIQWHPHHQNLCISGTKGIIVVSDDQTVRFWGSEVEWKEMGEMVNKTGLNAVESQSDEEQSSQIQAQNVVYSESDEYQ